MRNLLTIGKVAALAGVSSDTIRYYERLGLLQKPSRTAAGYRVYAPAIAKRLTLIDNAKRFGFSLREIVGFLGARDGGDPPCRNVRAAAEQMLAAVDRQISDLATRRQQMKRTLDAWDETLHRTPSGQPARLLERVSHESFPKHRRSVPRRGVRVHQETSLTRRSRTRTGRS
jgi:DNA-binding transcriptional MerR regulator